MAEIKLNKKEEKELFFKALLGSPFFNIFASVLATFVVGAIFMKVGGGVPISVTQTSVTKTSTFDVEGEGKVVVVPDIAKVQLAVERKGRNIKRLQEQVDKVMDELGRRLKGLGVSKKDIRTVAYNVYPDYEEEGVFKVQSMVEVGLRDLEKVGRVLGLAGELGLDRMSGPEFSLSDELRRKVMREAREKAIKQAKEKAKELAGLAGMELGRIVNVREEISGWPSPWVRDFEPVQALNGGRENKVSIEPGTSEVKVRVVVSWEVE